MTRTGATVVFVLLMVAVVVFVDVRFLQHRFWERLAVNVGIVLTVALFYFAVLRRR